MPIALALGGGAALGWAHLGVLRVLRDEGIEIGAVAGTSIGALAAVCLAADRLDILEDIARRTTRRRLLSYLDPHLARGALLGGRRVARELRQHLGGLRFEDLAMPTALVAADLDTGEEVRLVAGPVVDAIQASIALPALFRPVRRDGRTLIDGGMVANMPVGAARMLAPALPVVAVDLMGDYAGHVQAGAGQARSSFATLRAAWLMLVLSQTRLALRIDPPALTLTLPVGHLSLADFHLADDLIAIGAAAARAALPAIRAIAA